MGTDCKMRCDDTYYALDRWYVFSPKILSKVSMSKSEALRKIRELARTRAILSEVKVWDDRSEEKFYYHHRWLMAARKIIKSCNPTTVTFFNEYDVPIEYY